MYVTVSDGANNFCARLLQWKYLGVNSVKSLPACCASPSICYTNYTVVSDINSVRVSGPSIHWDQTNTYQVTDSETNVTICDVGAQSCTTGLGIYNAIDIVEATNRQLMVCEGVVNWQHFVDQYIVEDEHAPGHEHTSQHANNVRHHHESFHERGQSDSHSRNDHSHDKLIQHATVVVQDNTHNIQGCWELRPQRDHAMCRPHRHHGPITVPRSLVHNKPNDFEFLEPYLAWHTKGFESVDIPNSIGVDAQTVDTVNINILYRECEYDYHSFSGETGATGPAGDTGPRGIIGPRGRSGANGLSAYELAVQNGFAGSFQAWLDSLIGADGPAGPKGMTGETGPIGPTGAKGADGEDGAAGPKGMAGLDGLSAYELAVQNGFVGTFQDWLDSLIGADGPIGPMGLTGAPGINGVDGAIGPVGPAGADGKYGADGTDGADGAIGPAGSDGLDCYDLNGNGVFDPLTEDINGDGIASAADCIGATGADGVDGNDGADGTNGADGATGPVGPAGADGPQGLPGLDGTDGNDGAPGMDGDMGPTGPAGSDGIDGTDGATGPQVLLGMSSQSGSSRPKADYECVIQH